jgi:hypothetical protein
LFDELSEEFKEELGIVWEEDKVVKRPRPKKKQTPVSPEKDYIEIPQLDTIEIEKLLKLLNGEIPADQILNPPPNIEKGEIKPHVKKTSFIIEPDGGEIKDTFYNAIYVPPMMDSLFNNPIMPGKKPVPSDGFEFRDSKEEPKLFSQKPNIGGDSIIKIAVADGTPQVVKQSDERDLYHQIFDRAYYQEGYGWMSLVSKLNMFTESIEQDISPEIWKKIKDGSIKTVGDAEAFLLEETLKKLEKEVEEYGTSSGARESLTNLADFSRLVEQIYNKKQDDSVSRKEYNKIKEIRKEVKKVKKKEDKNIKKENKKIKEEKEKKERKESREKIEYEGKTYTKGNLDRKLKIESKKENQKFNNQNQTAKDKWKEYLKKNPNAANSNEERVKNGAQKTNGDSAGCQCSKCKKLIADERAAKLAAEKLAALLKAAKEAAKKIAEESKKEAEKLAAEEAAKKAAEEAAKKAEEEAKKRKELEELMYRLGLIPWGMSPDMTIEEMEAKIFTEELGSLTPSVAGNSIYQELAEPGLQFPEDMPVATTVSNMASVEIFEGVGPQEDRKAALGSKKYEVDKLLDSGGQQIPKEPMSSPPGKDKLPVPPPKKQEEPEIDSKGKGVMDYYGQKQTMTTRTTLSKDTTSYVDNNNYLGNNLWFGYYPPNATTNYPIGTIKNLVITKGK